jgi:hypothetical protein
MEKKIFEWTTIVADDYSRAVDLDSYTHLRLFHSCRPASVDSYYQHGIRVVPEAELADRFREIYADYPPAAVIAAIAAFCYEAREARVDAVLDLRFLIQYASHYLVQGSERLKAWARRLPARDGRDPTARLKSLGRPTAFVIDAPLPAVDRQDRQDLQMKLNLLAENGAAHVCDAGDLLDFTTSFAAGIPPKWIVRHDFIDEAADPDDRRKTYRYVPS